MQCSVVVAEVVAVFVVVAVVVVVGCNECSVM